MYDTYQEAKKKKYVVHILIGDVWSYPVCERIDNEYRVVNTNKMIDRETIHWVENFN